MKKHTKNQHYVFQRYLKPWTENDKIFCLRNGKSFQPNTKNIGQERYFYEAKPLTQRESDFIDLFLLKCDINNKPGLEKLLDFYKSKSKSEGYDKKCGLDDLHGEIETSAIHILYHFKH